jgi:hypothetical protein
LRIAQASKPVGGKPAFAAAAAGFSAYGVLRGRSFLTPRKEPKEAALPPLLLRAFPPTGFDAEQRENSRKMNELIFREFSLCSFARELAWRPQPNWRK